MDLFSRVRRYVTNWRQTATLLREPDATAILQSWHVFDKGERRWAQILSKSSSSAATHADISGPGSGSRKETPTLSLFTWNVGAFEKHPDARIGGIIAAIQNHTQPPDIIFFQEVSHAALDFILAHSWVRENWYMSDADATNWGKQQFGAVSLLSRRSFGSDRENSNTDDDNASTSRVGRVGRIWRVKYPSRFGRDALCCEVFLQSAGIPVRLVNVHLDSLPVQPSLRPRQLAIVAGMLHGAGRGVVAGDFNPVSPEDNALVAKNGLVDVWVELHPDEDGYTWGVDGQQLFPPNRMDKVALVGLRAREIEVIHPGVLPSKESGDQVDEVQLGAGKEVNIDGEASQSIPWSDHSGLRCSFGLVDVNVP